MSDMVALGVALVVCFLPGIAVCMAFGIRRPLVLLALAAPVSAAVAVITGTVTALPGLSFGAVSLGLVTAAAGAVGAVRVLRSRSTAVRRRRFSGFGFVGCAMALVGVVIGVVTWMRGLGGLATYPQEHDTVIHTLLTAYISRTGRGAAWQLLPVDVLDGTPTFFYPAGMHLLAAATADVVGDSVIGLNATTVVLLAVVVSVSAAALTAVAARRLQLSSSTAALAAGFASLVAAGMYRPTFQMTHDGGSLPNAAALALTPAVLTGLLLLSTGSRSYAVAVGLACAGVVGVHPSAVVSVGVTVVAWWIGDAVSRVTWTELRRLLVPLGFVAATAAVVVMPLLLSAASAASRTAAFPADSGPTGASEAVGRTVGFAYGGYLDPTGSTGQLWAAALVMFGIAAVLILRRGYGSVIAWGTWAAVTIAYFLSPAAGVETAVTSVFYKAAVRVWSHVSLLAPVLAGLGVALAAASVAVLLRRFARRIYLPIVGTATALVVATFVGYAAGPASSYATRASDALATRYSRPDFVRVGDDDRRAAAWLASRIEPGQRVMNSANDGSTLLYVEYGIPIVNISTLGLAGTPYTYELLRSFDRYPEDPVIRRLLTDLNIRWIYVDAQAPAIGTLDSAEDWASGQPFSVAPGLQKLVGLPGLREEFRSGSVRVFSLDLAAIASKPGRP